MRHQKSKVKTEESGSALVEFSIAMVVILTLLLGTVDLGRALYTYDWVCDAARLGTRFMMVRGQNCTELSGGCPASVTNLQTYLKSLAFGLDTGSPPLTITASCTGPNISPTQPPCAVGASVVVTVQYQFSFLSPLSPHSWQMQSTSVRVVLN